MFSEISDDTKNKQFRSDVRQNPLLPFFFFFFEIAIFRSAGNVIQQIKKSRLKTVQEFGRAVDPSLLIHREKFIHLNVPNSLQISYLKYPKPKSCAHYTLKCALDPQLN